MKTLLYIAFLACLAIFSCKQNEEDKPIPDPNTNSNNNSNGNNTWPDCSQPCSTDLYKKRDEFFPYTADDFIYFEDEFGNIDTIFAEKRNLSFSNSIVMHGCVCFSYLSSKFVTKWDTTSNGNYVLYASFSEEYSSQENTIESKGKNDFKVYFGLLGPPQGEFKFEDQIEINGENFFDLFTATCMAPTACTQVEKLVFARNVGLLAYFRNGKWWKKI